MTDSEASPEATDLRDVLRRRRAELGLSQAELASRLGVDRRQVRRYETGESQPTLVAARALATALGITLDELAGAESRRIDLSGGWWACWQTWQRGKESLHPHEARITQRGEDLDIVATTRGPSLPEGGYLWRGQLRLWDNEALMGWYVANEEAVRSKGTMYFSLHQQGLSMIGRWVGLSYDGPLVTGWAAMARTRTETLELIEQLLDRPDSPSEGHLRPPAERRYDPLPRS